MSNFISKIDDVGRSIRRLQEEMVSEGITDRILIDWLDYAWEIIRDVEEEYWLSYVKQNAERGG